MLRCSNWDFKVLNLCNFIRCDFNGVMYQRIIEIEGLGARIFNLGFIVRVLGNPKNCVPVATVCILPKTLL